MDFEPGSRLGPYLIEDEIGRGGFATVYRADDARFGKPVAIKALAAHLAAEDEAVERFVAEARALRSVESESVVSVFDIAETVDGRPYMVLQYADRGTLLSRLLEGNPATTEELGQLVDFFEQSLGALHERAMVHRDVKPSNVLLTTGTERVGGASLLKPDDRLLLGDLGLVKDISAGTVTRGSGSAAYASPEQRAVVSRVDTRTDIYAASAVLTEAAAGRVRRPDESWEQVIGELQARDHPSLGNALLRGLDADPEQRPVGIQQWASELRAALRPGGAETAGPRVVRRPNRILIGIGALMMLAGIGGIVASMFMSNQPTNDTALIASSEGLRAIATATAVPTPTPVPVTSTPTPPTATAPASEDTTASGAANALPGTVIPPCGDPERGTANGSAPSGLIVSDVTDTTITIAWTGQDQAFSLFLDNRYLDNARKNSNQYVVEGLEPGSVHDVVIAAHDAGPEQGALVCATTLPVPPGRAPIGLVMATDLFASEITETSVRLNWTPAASGGRYTLYAGHLPEGKNFPTIIGAGGVSPEETSFLFEDLEPGATVVIGLRTVLGENQSGLAWIEVTLAPE